MTFLYRFYTKLRKEIHKRKTLSPAMPAEIQLLTVLRQDIELIASKQIHATNFWSEQHEKLSVLVKNTDARNFLNWQPIVYTMFSNPEKGEFEALKSAHNWSFWGKTIQEDTIGRPLPYQFYKKSSGNLIHHAYSLHQFLEHTKLKNLSAISSIFEFGGGYGSFCRMVFRAGFQGQFTIFDLPIMLAFQKYFLNSIPDLGLKLTSDLPNQTAQKTVVLMNEIEKLKNLAEIDLFVALWSLSEVPVALREEMNEHLYNKPKFYLIAYQPQFFKLDNRPYFEQFKARQPNYEWFDFEHPFVLGNRFLIGQKL